MARPFPAYKGSKPYVFVSYSHKDTSTVYPELSWLRDSGFNVWYDEGIEAGSEWSEALATQIAGAKLFLYFVTPDSAESQNCRNEVNFALAEEIPTLAVHLKKTDLSKGLSLSLSARQAMLKYEMADQEYREKLQDRVSTYLGQSSLPNAAKPMASENTRKVWLGLAALIFLALGYLGYGRLEDSSQQARQGNQTEFHELAIAILPLTLKGEDASTQFYATDLVNNLRSQLRRIPGVSVRAPTSSQAVQNAKYDLQTIAKRLNVQHTIHGNLDLTGSDLAISISVADETGETPWTQLFHATSKNFKTIQAEIAGVIAEHLGIKLTPRNSNKIINPSASAFDTETYDLFLRARSAPMKEQLALFMSALEQFPRNATFYAEVARIYTGSCWGADDRNSEMCDLAIQYAERGLKLDPNLPGAIAVLALVHGIRYEYQAAQAALNKHMQLPDREIYSDAILATYLNLGQLQLAWDAAQSFYQNDPLNPAAAFFMGAWAYHLKNDASLSEHFERIQIQLDPLNMGIGAYPSVRKHRVELSAAIEQARLDMPGFWGVSEALAESWVRPHYEPSYTSTALAEFRSYYERGDIRPAFFFQVLMFFYQTDEAMDLAFELYDQRTLNIATVWLRPPGARKFRSHPRFVELMQYIGIASYWDDVGWPHFCELRDGEYFCGLEIQVQ